LERIGIPLQMGVTAWMGILAITTIGALLSLVPALARKIRPGYAGLAALILLGSEMWAAVDPRWGSGMAGPVSYRTLLTLGLAAVGLWKARSTGLELSMSSAAAEGEPRTKGDAKKEKSSESDDDGASSSRKQRRDSGKGRSKKGAKKSGKGKR
jgi:hypothetical protein